MLIFNDFSLNFLFRCYRLCVTYSQNLWRMKNWIVSKARTFRNCCSILLNCEKITRYWKDERLQSNKMSVQIDQQDFQQDFHLFTNDRVFINIHCFRICFDKRSFASTSINKLSRSHETLVDKKRKNQLIASRRSWKRTRNNVTSVHRIQHLTKLTSN